jgi:hypothetical protein
MVILFIGLASSIPFVSGHAHGKTYQAWASTPPTIDGEIVSSEWEKAASVSFTITIGGNPYAAIFYVMNTETTLYVALKIADDDLNADQDAFAVYFDNDNDGSFEAGDDGILLVAGATGFVDRFLQPPMMALDITDGGTTDGSGACAAHAGYNHFELSHPLNSTDDAHDFSLGPMMTVGFTTLYADDGVGQEYWPAAAAIPDATGWADIVIASPPPTLTAWTDVAPTIDGTVGPEWSGASHAQFAIGWTYTGEVWVMNNATDLYVALKVADSSLTASDMCWISFDNNNDGSFVAGDDLLAVYGNSQFSDAFWGPGPPATLDTSAGGTSDGEGASSGSGGFNYFEFKHPLDSGDDAHDFSLSPGSTVGFSLEYIEASGYWGDWPSHNPKSWAHITVASAPVPSPDFTISADPASLSIGQGAAGTSAINVTSMYTFSAAVALSHSWVGTVPTGVTVDLPGPVTPPSGGSAISTLTATASSSASTGTFTLRVTGTSGALTHDTDVSVEITAAAADFTITPDPASLSLGPGASGTSTIKVQSVGTFSAPVTLAYSGAPSGLTLAFSANPVIPPAGGLAESVLTVTVAGAGSGTYSITITGTSGALTRSAALSVQVTAAGGCLIATATYGSELSDEVQFLRNFRDHSILETRAGSSFMTAFNAWYYSFSPTFAQFIREQPTVKTVTKFALYPLMGILRIGAAAFYVFPTNLEAGAVVSGLLVSSLIGLVYLTPPLAAVLAYSPKARRMARRLQLPTVIVLFSALASLALITVLGGPAILMMIATSTIVLSCLLNSALCTSRVIMQAAKRD